MAGWQCFFAGVAHQRQVAPLQASGGRPGFSAAALDGGGNGLALGVGAHIGLIGGQMVWHWAGALRYNDRQATAVLCRPAGPPAASGIRCGKEISSEKFGSAPAN